MRAGEVTIQCGYHFGTPEACRMVQLRHCPGSSEWQEPKWVCRPCRKYLHGLFRYYRIAVPEHSSKETARALEFFGFGRAEEAQA